METQEHIEELVHRTVGGDRSAFTELVELYKDMAYGTALSILGNPSDAEDAVQDTLIRVYTGLGRLRDPKTFGGWLRSIVRRTAIDTLRARQRKAFTHMESESAVHAFAQASHAQFDVSQHHTELRDALRLLPTIQREAIIAYYGNNTTYKRTADYLGVPVSTLKARLRHARVKLHSLLSSVEDIAVPITREIAMSSDKISKSVQTAITQVVTVPVDESMTLNDDEGVVLFCAIPTNIEICTTAGSEVKVTGTKSSIGEDEDAAQKSVDNLGVYLDRTDDYLNEGPHEGEVFCGTTNGEDGMKKGFRNSASDTWSAIRNRDLKMVFADVDYFSELTTGPMGVLDDIRASLGKNMRITVVSETMEDICIPVNEMNEEIRRGFVPNFNDDKIAHGPRGKADLVVALPEGASVTIFQNQGICVRDYNGTINMVGCHGVDLDDIRGDVRLVNCRLNNARKIKGNLTHASYIFGGGNWNNGRATRSPVASATIEQVDGELDIDIGWLNLEVSDVSGNVRVRNRFGTTRFHMREHIDGSRYRVETDSGEIRMFVQEDVFDALSISMYTLCGDIDCDTLIGNPDIVTRAGNDPRRMTVSTVPSDDTPSDLLAISRDGNILLEKVR
jgi:RNA polymerase sigma-70 factor, ECF subfamily